MTAEHEDFTDEHHAITAATDWAIQNTTINWAKVAEVGDSFAENLTRLNAHRRKAVRLALLKDNDRAVCDEGQADEADDVAPAKAAELAVSELKEILMLVAGKLTAPAYGFIQFLSEHPEGASAMRAWLRHVGFSNAEITWLFDDLKASDHKLMKRIESIGGLETLLDHAYVGDDMSKVGFLSIDGNEVPAALARLIENLSSDGVTPGIYHLIPVAAAMVFLADEKEEAKVAHPTYETTLFAMVGARGTCYSSRSCTGSIYGRNVTQRTCKRLRGRSLRAGGACIKV